MSNILVGRGTRRALTGVTAWHPDPLKATFTPNMAIRDASTMGPFAAAPIIQGKWDSTGTPDILNYAVGDTLGNQTQYLQQRFDSHQGTILFWITPEWNGNDGLRHEIFNNGSSLAISKSTSNNMQIFSAGGLGVSFNIAAWTAGTTYFVATRFNYNNPLDGVNYGSVSVNNVHLYSDTNGGTQTGTLGAQRIGYSTANTFSADAVIEGFTIYRRVLTSNDGYGDNVGNDDELGDIYAAGAWVDPCTITGSWDVVFCMPTNSTPGILTTGTGHAWSHPHGSNIPDVWGMWDGGLPGTPYAVEFDGTATDIDCGSGATLDDIPDGSAFTAEGYFRADGLGASNYPHFFAKGAVTAGGWRLYFNAASTNVRFQIDYDGTFISYSYTISEGLIDGKWHHVAVTFDGAGAKTATLWVDGKDRGTSGAAVGNYVSDASNNFHIGSTYAGSAFWDGAIDWVRLSDSIRYTAEFVPPRAPPAVDGNTVEQWETDEGTGATAAAQVTSPANDGTITSGSWSSIWEVESTPVVPQSHTFDSSGTRVNCGSAADIDDLLTGAMTAECWVRFSGATYQQFMWKRNNGQGWYFRAQNDGDILVGLTFAGATLAVTTTAAIWDDDVYHHVAFTYDDAGDRKVRIYIDGIYAVVSVAASGAYLTDAANDLMIGARDAGSEYLNGAMSFARISDVKRYADGANFVPPARSNPPAPDGNTIRQFNFTDGAGTTLTDATGTANGTITPGTGVWLNTPDMAQDEPGARTYNNGNNVGSDGANDGITIIQTVTAETDHVIRAMLSYGQSGRAWPVIQAYDNTGAAIIGANFPLPRLHDVHTGANNSATLINTNGSFTQALVGFEVENITDQSRGTITAVSGDKTTITVTLAGGTDNDFDTNDEYVIRPPGYGNYCDYPQGTETIFVIRTPVGCVSADFKVLNAAGEGVIQVHQFEVLESLLDNGDHESLNGGFPGAVELLTGWTNSNLDAGDTEPEATVVHAGAQSLEWNVGANGEFMYVAPTIAVDKFLCFGQWSYGDGTGTHSPRVRSVDGQAVLQYDPAEADITPDGGAYWTHFASVWRAESANFQLRFHAGYSPTGDRWSDDIYVFALDDVSLTVTPASEANSTETPTGGRTGIRVDGADALIEYNVPTSKINPKCGDLVLNWTPRHSDPNSAGVFGTQNFIGCLFADLTNYINFYWIIPNQLRALVVRNGVGATATWATAGASIVPGTTYLVRLQWSSSKAWFFVDNVLRAQTALVASQFDFSAGLEWHWGGNYTSSYPGTGDAVFSQA